MLFRSSAQIHLPTPAMPRRQTKAASPAEMEHEDDSFDQNEVSDAPPSINPYTVLGLENDASAEEVKKAYRKLALQHHPGAYFFFSSLLADSNRHANDTQTRHGNPTSRPRTRNSKRSPAPTPSFPMNAVVNATMSPVARPRRLKMTTTLTGSLSTASNSRMW